MCTNTTFSHSFQSMMFICSWNNPKIVIIIFLTYAYINISPFISAYVSQTVSFIPPLCTGHQAKKTFFQINFTLFDIYIFFCIQLYTAVQSNFLQWYNNSLVRYWPMSDIISHTMAFNRLLSHSFISVYEWEKVGCCNVDLLWRKETAYRLRFIRRRMPICLTEENNVFRVKSAHDGRG